MLGSLNLPQEMSSRLRQRLVGWEGKRESRAEDWEYMKLEWQGAGVGVGGVLLYCCRSGCVQDNLDGGQSNLEHGPTE